MPITFASKSLKCVFMNCPRKFLIFMCHLEDIYINESIFNQAFSSDISPLKHVILIEKHCIIIIIICINI